MSTLWDVNRKSGPEPVDFYDRIYFDRDGIPVHEEPTGAVAMLVTAPSNLIFVIKGYETRVLIDGVPVLEGLRCLDERTSITLRSKKEGFRHYYFTAEGALKAEKHSGNPLPCLFCGDLIEEGNDTVRCPGCGSLFHEGCWKTSRGCLSCNFTDQNDGLYSWVPEAEYGPEE